MSDVLFFDGKRMLMKTTLSDNNLNSSVENIPMPFPLYFQLI